MTQSPISEPTTRPGMVERRYGWFALVTVLVVGVLGWMFLLDEQWVQLHQAQGMSHTDAQQRLQQREERLSQVQQMISLVGDVDEERVEQLYTVLPRGLDAPGIISIMDEFADSAGIDVLSIDVVEDASAVDIQAATAVESGGADSLVEAVDLGVVQRAVMTINLRPRDSSYEGLRSFLFSLEHFVPLLDLRHFSYEEAADSYAFQLTTYYLPDLVK